MTLVLGGARSGKSAFAQRMAEESGEKVCFLATAEAGDGEMLERIRKHRQSRPAHWDTLELAGGTKLVVNPSRTDILLFDCFTVCLSNLMAVAGLDWPIEDEDLMPESQAIELMNNTEQKALDLVDRLRRSTPKLIIVSNEVGMGVVPAFRLGRIFRDLSGRLNQALADRADHVYFVIAGIPLSLKTTK
ncbi:MAG: bifunctional adenosylcobinamide kinase/adenosylcobinamide-phosphate guanylyltransferase [Candidatus Solincola sediminis]|uniref:Adenosylcobinamide kinase n=1 Tax=Candidatus Solincola sediminis TaxID=1797199 RepID=A0A1F2WQB2_9ACTN|nr:MAG: bifunctional adenosylcobinamide kinase/adenosylcobinamide-phosphate guanylyltransferase [Candidatus Solincola sediminis]OFW61510.1 MAG: bifunctional adenosylcobinamide kinase/adenosylcobinamide-phosphate guanylyltransferase [Candidatus Solincola sediminis]